MKYLFHFFLVIITQLTFGQPVEYYSLINKADSLFIKKEFRKSASTYSEAFKSFGWKGYPDDRYNAARAWALAGNADSSFYNLERIATKIYFSDYPLLVSDTSFASLHTNDRWKPLLEIVRVNYAKGQLNPKLSLKEQLNIIYDDDQKYRMMLDTIGKDSIKREEIFRLMGEKDHYNLMMVKNILDKYGWLGSDSIGFKGNEALFLVIQHADLKTQEKYYPMIKEAAKNGKIAKNSFALLEDRMNIRHGKKQIYGSQIGHNEKTNLYYVMPLEDPDNVDKRRSEVWLQPMSEYVKHWNIKWDVEQYKKDLPKLQY